MTTPEKIIITFCPDCKEETLEVTVEESGVTSGTVDGTAVHWFSGNGKCTNCRHSGYFSDSS